MSPLPLSLSLLEQCSGSLGAAGTLLLPTQGGVGTHKTHGCGHTAQGQPGWSCSELGLALAKQTLTFSFCWGGLHVGVSMASDGVGVAGLGVGVLEEEGEEKEEEEEKEEKEEASLTLAAAPI